jgi:Flp pilus assembly protein TadG
MEPGGYMNMGTHDDGAAKGRRNMADALVRRLKGANRAQTMVEFALALPIFLVVLLVGIQYAIIGEAALALGQVNYQGARYAAVNTTANQAAVNSYMLSVASPTISAAGGTYLTSTLSPAPPCVFGTSVTVSVSYDANHLLALPNPFLAIPHVFGGVNFPATLTNSESAFCEGSTN